MRKDQQQCLKSNQKRKIECRDIENVAGMSTPANPPILPQHGSKLASKIDQKSMPESVKNVMHLGIEFLDDLEGFWEGKWKQIGIKIRA